MFNPYFLIAHVHLYINDIFQFQHRFETEDAGAAWIWSLTAALLFPELLTVIKSGFIVLTQHVHVPPMKHLLVPLIFQTIHILGICVLFFIALPGMSVVTMSMVTTSACFIPSFFRAFSDRRYSSKKKNILFKFVDSICLLIQVSSICIWVFNSNVHPQRWSVLVGLLFTSFGWWEAYLPYNNAIFMQTFFDFLRDVRDQSLHKRKQHVVNCIVSVWKVFLAVVFVLVMTSAMNPVGKVSDLFSSVKMKFSDLSETVITPGAAPAILINETFSTCMASTRETDGFVPNLAYPDTNDCSGFWVRVCLEESPTLKYALCPGDFKYFSSSKSLSCYNEGSCCQSESIVSCGDRKKYENCPNPDVFTEAKFPENSDEFINWTVSTQIDVRYFYPFLVLLIQIVSTLMAYQSAYFALETRIGIWGFAVPMTFSPVILIPLLIFICNNVMQDNCYFNNYIPAAIFFSCSGHITYYTFFVENWIYFLAFLSQAWITNHIWTKKSLKLAKAELIFDTPFYDSLLIDQSLLLNRRMDDEKKTPSQTVANPKLKNVNVLGCATMWHETEEEMSKLLDSIQQIDTYTKTLSKSHEDYFDFETHIFFDNAFDDEGNPNGFVSQLVALLASRNIQLLEKFLTPYGGKLSWKLRNQTLLVCHLKDKTKIKIKKRWSQLLYFLQFLGKDVINHLDSEDNRNISGYKISDQNTFILALDGDVTFGPESIVKLIDLMKKDDRMGAVCGRIHPIGNGLISMYQKFEYAVGHWLQKTTEDVLGNVLCSPGCFSLYRLSAMVNSYVDHLGPVVLEFSKETKTAVDCIQHDQGEDRWLCTLLIERGWRIEYSAVSDAKTICPETFTEFYNQRRRWTPSTVANLFELIRSWQSLLKHGNLTIFHILYQLLMLAGTIIGPGSIFILLVGGFQLTFEISYWGAFIMNLIPISMFILVSLIASPSSQILCAKVLSMIYGLGMIAIVFGLIYNIWSSCPWSPSTLSLELTAGAFLAVGLLHPLEISYLMYGVVYYITIPCMYMLLPLYCVFNLDDVSWGTREERQESSTNVLAEKIRYIFNPSEEISELKTMLSEKITNLQNTVENLNRGRSEENIEQSDETDVGSSWIQSLEGEFTLLEVDEEMFIQDIIRTYLRPEKDNVDLKLKLKMDLVTLKNEIGLFFVFLNAAWAVGIFLLQVSSVDTSAFTLDWVLCEIASPLNITQSDSRNNGLEYMPLDPINFVFILFFLIVLFIQGKYT